MPLPVRPDILCPEPAGQLEVQLNRTALPCASHGILQVKVQLGPVERPIALIDQIGNSAGIHGAAQGLSGKLPVLRASDAVLRLCGQLHMVRKPELCIHGVDETGHILDLVHHLLRGHEYMGIVLSTLPYPHEAVQLP